MTDQQFKRRIVLIWSIVLCIAAVRLVIEGDYGVLVTLLLGIPGLILTYGLTEKEDKGNE